MDRPAFLDHDYFPTQALRWRRAELDEVARWQGQALRRHVRHAARSPFYRERLQRLGCDPEAIAGVEELRTLPLTARSDLETAGAALHAIPPESFADITLTSGTTGEPVVVPYTARDLERLAFNEQVAFWGAGVRPGDRVLVCVTLDRCFVAGLQRFEGGELRARRRFGCGRSTKHAAVDDGESDQSDDHADRRGLRDQPPPCVVACAHCRRPAGQMRSPHRSYGRGGRPRMRVRPMRRRQRGFGRRLRRPAEVLDQLVELPRIHLASGRVRACAVAAGCNRYQIGSGFCAVLGIGIAGAAITHCTLISNDEGNIGRREASGKPVR